MISSVGGNTRQCLETFSVVTAVGECYIHTGGRGQECYKPSCNDPCQDFNKTKVRKPVLYLWQIGVPYPSILDHIGIKSSAILGVLSQPDPTAENIQRKLFCGCQVLTSV